MKAEETKFRQAEKKIANLKGETGKIKQDLTDAHVKACGKWLNKIAVADRKFQRTAFQYFYSKAMATNHFTDGLIHRLCQGDDLVLESSVGEAIGSEMSPAQETDGNNDDEDSDDDNRHSWLTIWLHEPSRPAAPRIERVFKNRELNVQDNAKIPSSADQKRKNQN